VSQAEALWESKSQVAGLACQDTRYKGPDSAMICDSTIGSGYATERALR
jgi:hypothetical protein